MKKEPLYTKNSISINAPASLVWDVLTKSEWTVQYMYGCKIVSDMKQGSSIIWRGAADSVDYVTGTIVSLKPEKEFAFTVFDPHGAYPDVPENYLIATYTLSHSNGQTVLIVTQGDYSTVAEGEKRYADSESAGGWQSVLEGIKKLVEGSVQV